MARTTLQRAIAARTKLLERAQADMAAARADGNEKLANSIARAVEHHASELRALQSDVGA